MTTTGLTIGKRLALGFGSVLALMAVLAGLAIHRVGQIDDILIHINDVNSVKQRYAINFRGSVHDRSIAIRDVVLAATAPTAQRHADLIKKLDDDYQRSAAPLDGLFAARSDILPEEKQALAAKLIKPHFIPDLTNHSHAPNLTRKLIERGFHDDQIEKILFGNWMRIFAELL